MPFKDEAVRREYFAKYSREHAEERREISRRYVENHKVMVNEKARIHNLERYNTDPEYKQYQLDYVKNHRVKCSQHQRRHVALNKYGMSPEEYEKILPLLKTGPCSVCGKFGKMVIDHDHKTERFRGVICRSCNLILGFAKDSPSILYSAAKYLEGQEEVVTNIF